MTNRTVEEAADRNEPKWDCPTCGVTHVGARAQAALSSTPSPASECLPAKCAETTAAEVPSAQAFRDSFSKAAPCAGADHASWVNGYCRGWMACEVANGQRPASEPPAATDRLADAYAREIEEHESRGEKAVDGKWVTPPAARPEGGA